MQLSIHDLGGTEAGALDADVAAFLYRLERHFLMGATADLLDQALG